MEKGYEIYSAANGYGYVVRNNRYAIRCNKCGGSGIYWRKAQSASGEIAVPDVCYRCRGSQKEPNAKWLRAEEVEAHAARRQKADERREAKAEAERAARVAAYVAQEPEVVEPVVEYRHVAAKVGEQIVVEGVVTAAFNIDGFYGESRVIAIETEANEYVKMFSTAGWVYGVKEGDQIKMAAVVKKHDYYDGQAQTVVARGKKI